ncbi:hypothetical protein HY632_04560 [Candidatus Uhrbacteria bacterium]|nr:hypothetical protein [Candidatus Uhrbacteria bacterium]
MSGRAKTRTTCVANGRVPRLPLVRRIRRMRVQCDDRGMGRGSYRVVGPGGMPLAQVSGGWLPTPPGMLINTAIDQGYMVDERVVASLLAASLDCYRACVAAYRVLYASHGKDAPIVRMLAAAIERAHGVRP